MKMTELCRAERPREKMVAKGCEALTDIELLAILLRTGTEGRNVIDMARELVRHGDEKLGVLGRMSIDKLREVRGIGMSKAVTIAAAFEIGRRAASENSSGRTYPLSSPKEVYRLMQPGAAVMDHEECWALFLNRSNRLISKEMISKGGQDSTVIDNRIIIRKAIEKKASALILVHNHPSGNALPSQADITQTQALSQALRTCDLQLIDHVIISDRSYYSFADEELVETKK